MTNGLDLNISVSAIAVFAQGLISFFSPCVLPLLPMYIGYLAGGTSDTNENGEPVYKKSKVVINTLFFVVGISFALLLLGLAATRLGVFFQEHRAIMVRGGGIIIILFGLFQMGLFESRTLNTEKRFNLPVHRLGANPLVALLLGFTFSFAWTPCVGPMLSGVLLMSGTASTAAKGYSLIALYTLGFVIPFMLTGIFTTQLLRFFKKHSSIVRYTKKLGGLIMIIMGLIMATGVMNDISGYLNRNLSSKNAGVRKTTASNEKKSDEAADAAADKARANENAENTDTKAEDNDAENEEGKSLSEQAVAAVDFELVDQNGNTHKLSDYKGKTVMINFWATWCPPCRMEIPHIQAAYEDWGSNEKDVIILSVAGPNIGAEQDEEGIKQFALENGISYPILFDNTGNVFGEYAISSFPTTFMIDENGNYFGYLPGAMTRAIVDDIIQQTKDSIK